MWFFYLAIPIAMAMGLNNCSLNNQNNSGTTTGTDQFFFQSFEGDGQNIPRRSTSTLLVARLIKQNGSTLTAISGESVHFSINGIGGALLYNDIPTDDSGVARTFYSSADTLGTAIVTATAGNGMTTTFQINVNDYSPTSALISTSNDLEYTVNGSFSSPNRFDEIALVLNSFSTADTSSPITSVTNGYLAGNGAVTPTGNTAYFENIADPASIVNIALSATYPTPILQGSCTSSEFNTPALLYQPCDAINGVTFTRNLIAQSGTFGVTVTSTGASALDATNSNLLNIKPNGLKLISDINPNANDYATGYTPFAGSVYFAEKNTGQTKLFRTVGNTFFQVSNLNSGGDDAITNLVVVGNNIYFGASNGQGFKLYSFDGGTQIQKVTNINPGGNDIISSLAVFSGMVFFVGSTDGANGKLYRYDPGSGNIKQMSNLNATGDDGISGLTTLNGVLYFSSTASGNSKLYAYNGTTITQITNINSGGDDSVSNLVYFGTNVYFAANASSGVRKLYMYNGTATARVTDLLGATVNDGIDNLIVSPNGSMLYFSGFALTSGIGIKLYSFNGTTLSQTSNLNSGGTDGIQYPTVYSSYVFFRATTDGANYHVFRYDGVKIVQISDVFPASGSDENPINLGAAYNGLYFSGLNIKDGFSRIYRYCDGDTICTF
jgi:hypothetical protein